MTTTHPTAASTIEGTGVVPGLAYAPAAWTRPRPAVAMDAPPLEEDQREGEASRFDAATRVVAERLTERAERATGPAKEVLEATAALARDRGWLRAATRMIKGGTPAPQAAAAATGQFVETFEKLGGLMAERATDLRDIRDRVVAELDGLPEPGIPTPESPVVLLAEDLAPADTAELDPKFVVALVTSLGGPTSHTAIISRQLGIPCVVAATGLDAVEEGEMVLVDGAAGSLRRGVPEEEARAAVEADRARREVTRAWQGPGATKDGRPVKLMANVQDGAAARAASAGPVEGVGLFRTELCFLTADHEPSVATQARIYRGVLEAFPGKRVVVRTLDAGSDKPLRFANLEHEENPALGVRGIRVAARDEGLLTHQLDAVVQAAEGRDGEAPWVMAPMVATVPEAAHFAALCRERRLVPGIMVEVPSVALLARHFLEHVDFLSIGTNDLSQYAMAADRLSPHLADLTDPWQPAVLSLVAMTAAAGKEAGKPVGVCGEAAASPDLACVLVGLGITSLSMAATAVPAVGARLAEVSFEACEEAGRLALQAPDSRQARQAAAGALG
ncbi:phosphoenolpyruvate--protein phosphotransferase [Georgenia sp. AZ-5]|uniref:phosphoenolpyruvate--protein phosphotransferase n=1 Tax=Georgenia sp. AZ-5 TaxID=3367526 RepID=UPI0037547623